MIARPKLPHFYPGRPDDCVGAIEARFADLVRSPGSAFIDRETISARLLAEASHAGWAQHEIGEAIDVLVARRDMVKADNTTPS